MSIIEYSKEDLIRAADRVYPTRRLDAEAAGRSIAARWGITYGEMIGSGRYGNLPDARREFYSLLREAGWSYPQIGRFCGGRDHTTIMAAVGKGDGRVKA